MWILCIMSWCFLPRYLTSLEVFFFECPYLPHGWPCCQSLGTLHLWQAARRLSKPPRCHPKSISADFLSFFWCFWAGYFYLLCWLFLLIFVVFDPKISIIFEHARQRLKAWMCLLQGEQRHRDEFRRSFCRVSAEFPSRASLLRALWGSSMLRWPKTSASRRSVRRMVTNFCKNFIKGGLFLKPMYTFSWDFFHLHISLEEVLKMQILFSCQSIHLTWKKPTGDASLGCLHTRWRRNLRPRRCVPRHGCTGEAWRKSDPLDLGWGDPSPGHRGGQGHPVRLSRLSIFFSLRSGRDIVSRFLVLGSSKEALAGVSGGSQGWMNCQTVDQRIEPRRKSSGESAAPRPGPLRFDRSWRRAKDNTLHALELSWTFLNHVEANSCL